MSYQFSEYCYKYIVYYDTKNVLRIILLFTNNDYPNLVSLLNKTTIFLVTKEHCLAYNSHSNSLFSVSSAKEYNCKTYKNRTRIETGFYVLYLL